MNCPGFHTRMMAKLRIGKVGLRGSGSLPLSDSSIRLEFFPDPKIRVDLFMLDVTKLLTRVK
jgi:hypothetical protein